MHMMFKIIRIIQTLERQLEARNKGKEELNQNMSEEMEYDGTGENIQLGEILQ